VMRVLLGEPGEEPAVAPPRPRHPEPARSGISEIVAGYKRALTPFWPVLG